MFLRWLRQIFADNADQPVSTHTIPPTAPPDSPAQNVPESSVNPVKEAQAQNLNGAPPTLRAELANQHLCRPIVFDPALKHFVNARRAGEPTFTSDAATVRWNAIRLAVLDHILRMIASSKWREHLVLRGSVLLSAWYRCRARKPGDIDWVVTPARWNLADRTSKDLLAGVEDVLRGTTVGAEERILIPDRSFASTEIWSYERAPGQRIIVPWTAEDSTFNGTIQLDFVFGEPLPSGPVPTVIQLTDQSPITLLAATPEQSLCWKLLWLATDSYATGKDLFDAVLLAETTPLNRDLLKFTFELAKERLNPFQALDDASILNWHVEWNDFQAEYPQFTEPADIWKQRLVTALGIRWNP